MLLHRRVNGAPEVLLVRPGGPLWERRRSGAWQLPKGLIEPGEDATQAARRASGAPRNGGGTGDSAGGRAATPGNDPPGRGQMG